jgi:hypothetical protein
MLVQINSSHAGNVGNSSQYCDLIKFPYFVDTTERATVNQHPPVHHPLDASYYSVVDEPQLSSNLVSPW